MPIASRDGVDLYYEVHGLRTDPPILLVCGLGMQMIAWDSAWFELLASRGFFVVAYDNRDSGLSTHLVEEGTPDLLAFLQGGEANIAYLLADMAEDAIAVLDAVGLDSVHLLGISMGGMIVQEIAIRHPARVRTLCSVMSTTGDASVGQPSNEALEALFSMSGGGRQEVIEGSVKAFSIIGSPGYPADEDRLKELAGLSYDRDSEPTGI
ncbi:MAG TPA: alpha/beta hydrolase, partial [Acidimicrobiales bacterium]|nr:alpha/beta hydrolase [Acidimicrobiales bacterium]